MPHDSQIARWQRALVAMSGTTIVVAVVAALYWAQAILIPVALAIFFTFLLSPLVRALQHLRLGRIPSVLLVVASTGVVLAAMGWLVGGQVTGLMTQLPDHTTKIKGKIKSIREHSSVLGRLERMADEITGEFKSPMQPEEPALPMTPAVAPPELPPWLKQLPGYLSSAAETIAALALTLVLTVFMLLNREDLRDRFLRLIGNSRMSATTKAVDDAAHRVSRYLLTQALINTGFGICVAMGLFLIGVEYFLLWGVIAGLMRYVPYLGTWIAAAMPITLSLAISDSLWQPLAVFGLYLVLEMLSGSVLEPWLLGRSIGVSGVAQLVSAAFWAFLWGPLGLVLSAPMTVVLLVLGKYVPQLEFLDILLGNQPALRPRESYYQRLLARDQDEAAQLVLCQAKILPAGSVYDELLIPSLNYVKRDRENDCLTAAEAAAICQTTREILADLGHQLTASKSTGKDRDPDAPPVRVLACPARDEADRVALEMLEQLLDPNRWSVEVVGVDVLTGELLEQAAAEPPALICVGALPPGGLARTRYLCKRLRSQFPLSKIIVGRWGLEGSVEENRAQFVEAGADLMSTTLLEARKQLNGWLPILVKGRQATAKQSA